MRAQFDPDVWAALFLIIAVGVGGAFMLSIFANTLSMHGVLNLFDREIGQKGLYIVLGAARNDYGLGYDKKISSNFSSVHNFYVVSEPNKDYMYYKFMKPMDERFNRNPYPIGYEDGETQLIYGVCYSIIMEDDISDAIKKCIDKYGGDNVTIYQYEDYVYSPAAPCTVYLAFRGG